MSRPEGTARGRLEAVLGHRFVDRTLLAEALTHRSAAPGRRAASYERLEFLGDRVLGLCAAEMLFRHFEDEDEGALAIRQSALVRREAPARVARELGLGDQVSMSPDAARLGARDNPAVLCDVMEALLGALYLDAGLDTVRDFVARHWSPLMMRHGAERPPRDAKTRLQEWALARGLALPSYVTLETLGPDHAPTMTVACEVAELGRASATGRTRRAAEQAAAEALLRRGEGPA